MNQKEPKEPKEEILHELAKLYLNLKMVRNKKMLVQFVFCIVSVMAGIFCCKVISENIYLMLLILGIVAVHNMLFLDVISGLRKDESELLLEIESIGRDGYDRSTMHKND